MGGGGEGVGDRDRAEMECGGNEAPEVFGGQIPPFSESLMNTNTVVSHRKAVECNCWKNRNQPNEVD